MRTPWRIIDFSDPSNLPKYNQEIDFSIAAGKGASFSNSGRMRADLDTFRRLLEVNPQFLIIWQPSPPPAKPPAAYEIVEKIFCDAPLCQQIQCVRCSNGVCVHPDPAKHCDYAKKSRSLFAAGGGGDDQ